MKRDDDARALAAGLHPPRADGERDGGLEAYPDNPGKDPIQLDWTVNETCGLSGSRESSSPSAQGGWGRGIAVLVRLAHHHLHHPVKLNGVQRAPSKGATAGFAARRAIARKRHRSDLRRIANGGVAPVPRVDLWCAIADTFSIYSPSDTPQGLGRGSVFPSFQNLLGSAWEMTHAR